MVNENKKEFSDLWGQEDQPEGVDSFTSLINKKHSKPENVIFTSEYNPFLSDEENETKNNINEFVKEKEHKPIIENKEIMHELKEESVFKNKKEEDLGLINKTDKEIKLEENVKEEELWSDDEPDFLTEKFSKMNVKESKKVTFSDSTETFLVSKESFKNKETNFDDKIEEVKFNKSKETAVFDKILTEEFESTKLKINEQPLKKEVLETNTSQVKTNFIPKVHSPMQKKNESDIYKPQINLIPKAVSQSNDENNCFNFNKTSKIIKITVFTILAYPHTQKRVDFNTQQEKEVTNSKFVFYKNQFKQDFNKIKENKEINELLKLKEKTIDNICGLLTNHRRNFISKKIEENYDLDDINTILQTYFLNKEIAIQIALEKKIWHLALFMSDCNEKVKEEYLKNFNENVRVFLGGKGEIIDNWKDNFELLLRNPNESLLTKLINSVNETDKLFILLSFYFVHERALDCKLFFNNFYFLNLFLENNFSAVGIDKFIFRFLKVLHEEGNYEEENKIYQKYKKLLSKDLIDLYENKKGWLTGFRSIIDKSISKIVGVESKEEGLEDNKFLIKEENKEKLKNEESLKKEEKKIDLPKKQNFPQSYKNYLNKEKINESKEKINAKEKINNEREEIIKETEVKEEKRSLYSNTIGTKSTVNLPTEEKSLYSQQSHAKSVDNFFDNEEDIPSLDSLVEKEKKEEEKPSFFSRFNIFGKKTQKHKVDLKGNADFVYDPVTKRWVNSSQKNEVSEVKEKKTPVKEIPKPSFQKKQTNFDLDGSITSRYVNKDVKKEEINTFKNFIPKPK